MLYVFKIVPAFLRDLVYDWVASNRYRWFGKKEACMIPTPEMQTRFIN
jgi:predicted DCC family thiol-disulfide oxidoreductase YuxK